MTTKLKIAKNHHDHRDLYPRDLHPHLYYSVELGPVEVSSPGELSKVPARGWCVTPVEFYSDLAHAGVHTDSGRLPTFIWYRHFSSEMKTALQKMLL